VSDIQHTDKPVRSLAISEIGCTMGHQLCFERSQRKDINKELLCTSSKPGNHARTGAYRSRPAGLIAIAISHAPSSATERLTERQARANDYSASYCSREETPLTSHDLRATLRLAVNNTHCRAAGEQG